MKCFHVLPCENMAQISQDIHEFLDQHTDIIEHSTPGWHFLDSRILLSKVPNLIDYFRRHQLMVRHSAVTVVLDDNSLPKHVDEPPVIAKINMPVINTNGWSNRWYHDDKIIAELVDQDQPIVFNSQIAHGVVRIGEVNTPRIVASFTFFNEPLEFLQ